MKIHFFASGLATLVFASIISIPSARAEKASETAKKSHSDAIPSHASAPSNGVSSSASSGLGFSRKGVGFATGNFGGASTAAFSFWADLDGANSVQALLGFAQTDPLGFGVGGIFHHTLIGSQTQGLHAGGGVQLGAAPRAARVAGGSASAFYISFAPVLGFHFTLPGLNAVQLSLDGGPQFMINDGSFNFALGGLSSAMGLSVHYFF